MSKVKLRPEGHHQKETGRAAHSAQKPRAPGEKLMNEASAKKAMRKKFRHGRADNELTAAEKKLIRKKQLQGRRAIKREMAEQTAFHEMLAKANKDQNVGVEAVNDTTAAYGALYETTESAKYSGKLVNTESRKHSFSGYGGKLGKTAKDANLKVGGKTAEMKVSQKSKAMQRTGIKKAVQRKFAASSGGRSAKNAIKQTGNVVTELGQRLVKEAVKHPEVALFIVTVLFVIMIVSGAASSVGLLMSSLGHSTVETSFSADDDVIRAVEADYKTKEEELRRKVENIESDYPGYDEYRYDLAEIGHNPYELAAILTVLYEAYTEDEVQESLDEIFEFQYKLTTEAVTETRYRRERRSRSVTHDDGSTSTEYYYVDVPYEYHILKVKLENIGLAAVARKLGFSDDEMARFRLLVETKGNKPYLFTGDPYVSPDPGADDDYDIPPEALTDTKFANMIREAEKYLGMPYVWGGSSPSTSFDCSGYVSWVINHCGNGWNVGRQTANGLLGCCTRVPKEEAKPGDLVFFKGTYSTPGASHVGIYVGDGMMIHCGNPIQYTSINTRYWKKHFYTFGRIND